MEGWEGEIRIEDATWYVRKYGLDLNEIYVDADIFKFSSFIHLSYLQPVQNFMTSETKSELIFSASFYKFFILASSKIKYLIVP